MKRRVYEPGHPLAQARFDLIKELQQRLDGLPEVQERLKHGMKALRKTEREILSYYDLTDMEVDK